MSIPNHVSTTEVVLLELEILLTIISIGAWGGFVSYLLRKDKTEYNSSHESIKLLNADRDFLLHQFLVKRDCNRKRMQFQHCSVGGRLRRCFRESDLKNSWAAD